MCFFFQAEDGIRDADVTGVQTCALPISLPALNVMPLADGLSFEEGAAFPLVFLTAWHMLIGRARLRLGDDVLVHAGGSGVGTAAIHIAKLHGARGIATIGSPHKAAHGGG